MAQRSPEHIEREMFELRTRLNPEVTDLKKHLQPSVIADQTKSRLKDRLQTILNRGKSRLQEQKRDIQDSAEFQYSLARKAAKDQNIEPLTDAVRSDPRPAILLAVALTVFLTLLRSVLR